VDFPRDFADGLSLLTAFRVGRVIGFPSPPRVWGPSETFADAKSGDEMGKGLVVERMMVRLKPPKIGEVVRMKNCEMYFYLPEGLPEYSDAVLVGRESGRYIVEAFGRTWNIAMQCVEHDEECLLQGRWLDQFDRRVRRVKAMVQRVDALRQTRAEMFLRSS
jgi:hypothetical protein